MWSSPEANATLVATNAAPALPAARARSVFGDKADAAACYRIIDYVSGKERGRKEGRKRLS